MFACSAGLLVDLELFNGTSTADHLESLLAEWRDLLNRQAELLESEERLVLLLAGFRFANGLPVLGPPEHLTPHWLAQLNAELAGRLDAEVRLIDPDSPAALLGSTELFEAPLLLIGTGARLTLGDLPVRNDPGQLVCLWELSPRGGWSLPAWYQENTLLTKEDLLRSGAVNQLWNLSNALHQIEARDYANPLIAVLQAFVLLAIACGAGLIFQSFTGRIGLGFLLLGCTAWWLSRSNTFQAIHQRWCLQTILRLQWIWARFGLELRVRDLLADRQQVMSGAAGGQLLSILQARRVALGLQSQDEFEAWRRKDLQEAHQLFSDVKTTLARGERIRRVQRLTILLLVLIYLICIPTLSASQGDELLLVVAGLCLWLWVCSPIPLLSGERRRRAIHAVQPIENQLYGLLGMDSLDPDSQSRAEFLISNAGRELVDLVNDSMHGQPSAFALLLAGITGKAFR